jgi:predicted transcriptional regulator
MGANSMKPSKLEVYLEILKALKEQGQQKPSGLTCKPKIDPLITHDLLDFLAKQGLVTKACLGKRVTYKITGRGSNVLQYFGSMQMRNRDPDIITNYESF